MSQQSASILTPNTDEEFAVQALTIHGAFFERKCQNIITQAKNWTLREINYPVEHQGKASNLDIWAEKKDAGARLSFPIECKKNNPEFVDWVFFPRPTHCTSDLYIQGIEINQQILLLLMQQRKSLLQLNHFFNKSTKPYKSCLQRSNKARTAA